MPAGTQSPFEILGYSHYDPNVTPGEYAAKAEHLITDAKSKPNFPVTKIPEYRNAAAALSSQKKIELEYNKSSEPFKNASIREKQSEEPLEVTNYKKARDEYNKKANLEVHNYGQGIVFVLIELFMVGRKKPYPAYKGPYAAPDNQVPIPAERVDAFKEATQKFQEENNLEKIMDIKYDKDEQVVDVKFAKTPEGKEMSKKYHEEVEKVFAADRVNPEPGVGELADTGPSAKASAMPTPRPS